MIRHLLLLLLLVTTLACRAFVIDAPVVADAAASRLSFDKAIASGRCYAMEIARHDEGVLLNGSSATALPAGRYRLHLPLAMAPLGDLKVSAISIAIKAGENKRAANVLHFANADEFTDLSLDFTAPGGQCVPYSVTWAFTGEVAKKNRAKSLDLPEEPGDRKDIEDLGGEGMIAQAKDGTISLADLSKLPYHIAACAPHIEPLSPLQVTVTTDKIVYKPDERGKGTVTVLNTGAQAVKATIAVEVLTGLDQHRPLHTEALDVPAGGEKSFSVDFDAKELYLGAELHVTATGEDGKAAEGTATFAVSGNIWETAIYAGTNYSVRFRDREVAERTIAQLREVGYTGFESGFWTPDDFGDFTPDKEIFFGGHLCYPGSISAMQNYIEFAHKNGMAATLYAILGMGCGPPSFEMLRQHPDWFAGGEFLSDWFENWPLMETGKIPPLTAWPITYVAYGNSAEPLKVHASEFVTSHKMFGWDATRYDVYDALNKWQVDSTKVVRPLVEKELPFYQWGYNSSVPKGVTEATLDIMLGGHGLIMEEALRMITKEGGGSFANYLGAILTYREPVWQHGGHLGVCYDRPAKFGTLLDEVYLSSYMLAGGAHPYYGEMVNNFGRFPDFGLRYSAYLWDNRLRELKNPEAVVQFGGTPKLQEWQRLARHIDLEEDRHRLVLHLVNPPAIDHAMHNPAMKIPVPLRNLPVTINLPAEARVSGAWALCPTTTPTRQLLPVKMNGNTLTLTLPEVRFWTALVIEYSAKEGLK
ncbi:MAG: hypothetical protein ACYDBB_18710 [Armatimonadota bacterium]